MSKRIVVVGHGMVGQRFLETLTKDGQSDFAITMLAEEPRLAYDRVNLSKFFSGSSVEDLTLTTREFFDKNGIELHSGDPVATIDRVNKRVTTTKRRRIRIRHPDSRHRFEPVRAADSRAASAPACSCIEPSKISKPSARPARIPRAAW